jgi:hypothetical protein
VPGRSDDTLYLIGFVDSVTVESTLDHKDYRVSAGSATGSRRKWRSRRA